MHLNKVRQNSLTRQGWVRRRQWLRTRLRVQNHGMFVAKMEAWVPGILGGPRCCKCIPAGSVDKAGLKRDYTMGDEPSVRDIFLEY